MNIDKLDVNRELAASTAAGQCSEKLACFMLEIAQNAARYIARGHEYCHDEAVSEATFRMLKAFVEGKVREDKAPYSYMVCIAHNSVRNVVRKNRLYHRLNTLTDPRDIVRDPQDLASDP